jgi:hypothetical protein
MQAVKPSPINLAYRKREEKASERGVWRWLRVEDEEEDVERTDT